MRLIQPFKSKVTHVFGRLYEYNYNEKWLRSNRLVERFEGAITLILEAEDL